MDHKAASKLPMEAMGKIGRQANTQAGRLPWSGMDTCKSAHGPWRLSRRPALTLALPGRNFAILGLPSLFTKPT